MSILRVQSFAISIDGYGAAPNQDLENPLGVMGPDQHTPPLKPQSFLHLYFCSRCGVRAFSKGGPLPELGGQFHAVNVACLDDATNEELAQAPIHFADGRNDDWKTAAKTTYL